MNLLSSFPQKDFALIGAVLLFPLIGAFVNGVFGKRLGKDAVRLMALGAIGLSFILSVVTFITLMRLPGGAHGEAGHGEAGHGAEGAIPKLTWVAWRWLELPLRSSRGTPIDVAFGVDAMTATMMLVVTGVGFLIHLYSSEYMRKDPGYHRFFAYLNLFVFSMLVLITGDNLAVLFVGWEGVGLCSYLLIGFWFTEEKNATAGKKAFITNRIGDFGLLCAMAVLLFYCGSLSFDQIKAVGPTALMADVKIWPLGNIPVSEAAWLQAHPGASDTYKYLVFIFLPKAPITVKAATLVGWSIFLGCAGKSAQIPLYVWLPDAMAGPTPVSALIHAATMVTAGVYLVARMCDVFVLSPAAMATVAVTGAATAIFAATMGFFQRDLKKVLAYSTVSQLGFMFIGVGVGAFSAGFFHVFTHAFFKACLFLGAGSVIHAMHARIHDTDKSQDMSNMGGLRKYMPITHATFLVSCLSIAGVPFTAGFFSKDEILWKAYSSQIAFAPNMKLVADTMWKWPTWLGPAIYWVGIIGATMTSFYMFRAYFRTFWGEFRGWKIVEGWVDPHPHHDDDHDHGHDDHAAKAQHDDHEEHGAHSDGAKQMEGPVPHESPWPMTLPLVVLGTMALVAGFLGAEPLHIAPLIHKLEPIFESAENARAVMRAGVTSGQMWTMMVPGFLAFVVGAGAAYQIYVARQGEPEESFKSSMPGLYNLLYSKWYVDELYEVTVIGMVDALADIFTMFDRWVVDGIIARVTAFVAQVTGAALRLFHTGRVQVYAAAMTLGLLATGWFFVKPHPEIVVDDTQLKSTGRVVVKAGPGLGYTYKWSGEGVNQPDFSAAQSRYEFTVNQGARREVKLTVRNIFGFESVTTAVVEAPVNKDQQQGGRRPAPAPQGGR
ncbi:MAG: NADH-quinone oxidoreductase subunit L [Polyangiaceae bacterium]